MDGDASAAPEHQTLEPVLCHGRCVTGELNALARTRLCSGWVMTQTPHRELLRYVRIHWQRWQCSVAGFYYQRVTAPVQFWVACGRPAGFAPRIPWWQPFVFSYLVTTGWLRPSRQRERLV